MRTRIQNRGRRDLDKANRFGSGRSLERNGLLNRCRLDGQLQTLLARGCRLRSYVCRNCLVPSQFAAVLVSSTYENSPVRIDLVESNPDAGHEPILEIRTATH